MRDTENYDYRHSEILDRDIAIARDGTHVWTDDQVMYTREECVLLGEASPAVHKIKKVFGGIIVDRKQNQS